MQRKNVLGLGIGALALAALAGVAQAAPIVANFNGTVNSDFGTAGNWNPAMPVSGDPAYYPVFRKSAVFPGSASTPFVASGGLHVGQLGYNNVTLTLTSGVLDTTDNANGNAIVGQQSTGVLLSLTGSSQFKVNGLFIIGNDKNGSTFASGELRLADNAAVNVTGGQMVIGRAGATGTINFISTGAASETLTAASICLGLENTTAVSFLDLYDNNLLLVDGQNKTQLGKTFNQEFVVNGNTLSLVPEPASLSFLALSGLALLRRRR